MKSGEEHHRAERWRNITAMQSGKVINHSMQSGNIITECKAART
jgi:hypothetical protein